MFWVLIAVMLAAAVLIVTVPLYRTEKNLSATIVIAALTVTTLSAVIYSQIGTPELESQAVTQAPDIEEMVSSLAARLEENPDDLAGWKMLGRSYFSLRNFPGAIEAFQRAVDLEDGQDAQTLTDLGEAVLYNDETAIVGRAGQIFENALALSPNNPKALFYGGMASIQRGDTILGAERWEALLATSPPPEVQEILRQQIAELRGESPAPVAAVCRLRRQAGIDPGAEAPDRARGADQGPLCQPAPARARPRQPGHHRFQDGPAQRAALQEHPADRVQARPTPSRHPQCAADRCRPIQAGQRHHGTQGGR